MNGEELMVLYQKAVAETLRLYVEKRSDTVELQMVNEAIKDGTGKFGISVVPHQPMEVSLLFCDDQGGWRDLMRMTVEETDEVQH